MSHNLLPQVVHFALTSNIESMTVIQPQHKGGAFKEPAATPSESTEKAPGIGRITD